MNVDIWGRVPDSFLDIDHPGYIPRHSLQTWLPALWAPWLRKEQFYVSSRHFS